MSLDDFKFENFACRVRDLEDTISSLNVRSTFVSYLSYTWSLKVILCICILTVTGHVLGQMWDAPLVGITLMFRKCQIVEHF